MRKLALLVIVPLVASISGCIVAAVAAGATGVLYVKGASEKTYAHPVEKTYQATLATLDDLGVSASVKGADNVSGKIEAFFADGKKVTIDFKLIGEDVTQVTVRVGTFGDRDRGEMIFAGLDKRL